MNFWEFLSLSKLKFVYKQLFRFESDSNQNVLIDCKCQFYSLHLLVAREMSGGTRKDGRVQNQIIFSQTFYQYSHKCWTDTTHEQCGLQVT